MSETVGVGIDLVDVARFADALARRPRLTQRLFTALEQREAASRVERLAARFAAKEATWKALGVGLGAVDFHDVEVRSAASGAPQIALSGRAEVLAATLGVRRWHVSLTHTSTAAAATVIGASG